MRRPFGVVEGDLWEQVVDQVVVDNFVEEVATDEAKAAIDCAHGAFAEGPGLFGVVGNLWVGVVEEGDCDYERNVSRQTRMGIRKVTYLANDGPRDKGPSKGVGSS